MEYDRRGCLNYSGVVLYFPHSYFFMTLYYPIPIGYPIIPYVASMNKSINIKGNKQLNAGYIHALSAHFRIRKSDELGLEPLI